MYTARRFVSFFVFGLIVGALLLMAGCAFWTSRDRQPSETAMSAKHRIRIGTLPLEDLLPVFVAEQEGLLGQAGLDVDYIVFQSAQEQIAAMTAGKIDAMSADMVMLMMLSSGGTPMKAVGAIQGGPAGIIAGPDSKLASLGDLKLVPIAASSATCIEYIIDKVTHDAGLSEDEVRIQEIKKIPVRYEMLMSGKSNVAALPWPFFALAQSQGGRVLADYEQTSTYSNEVLAVSDQFLAKSGSSEAIGSLVGVWNQAVDLINQNPDAYRNLLIEKARLPKSLPGQYKVRPYPPLQTINPVMVRDMSRWAVDKGYLQAPISYSDLVLVDGVR